MDQHRSKLKTITWRRGTSWPSLEWLVPRASNCILLFVALYMTLL